MAEPENLSRLLAEIRACRICEKFLEPRPVLRAATRRGCASWARRRGCGCMRRGCRSTTAPATACGNGWAWTARRSTTSRGSPSWAWRSAFRAMTRTAPTSRRAANARSIGASACSMRCRSSSLRFWSAAMRRPGIWAPSAKANMTETVGAWRDYRAALYSPAASVVAQHRLAQEESMVRSGTPSRSQTARAACLALVSLLGACAPQMAQKGLENATPAIERDAFVTRDGLRLPMRHWDAPAPIAVIVALHGMSDYSNAFDMPGAWWAEHGITTLAYDQRGFGRSPNPGSGPAPMPCAAISTISSTRRARNIRTCRSMRWARAWAARWS